MEHDEGSGAVVAPDPFSLREPPARRGTSGLRFLPLLLLLAVAGCASAPAPGPVPEEPGAETGDPAAGAEPAGGSAEVTGTLDRLEALRTTRPSRAAALADSAYFRWRAVPELRDEAHRALLIQARSLEAAGEPVEAADRYSELLGADPSAELRRRAAGRAAALRIHLGMEPAALRAVLDHGGGLLEAERRELLAQAVSGMSAAEIRAVLQERSGLPAPEETILRTELARVLALTGRAEEGRLGPDDAPVVRVEAVLPLSGSLEPVGRFLRQGMEVALEAHRRGGGDSVAVVFRDDGSRPEKSRGLLRAAEEGGATAVLGPARSTAFAEALDARRDPALLVMSPTASSTPREGWNGYSLWSLESRERGRAAAVARWLVESAGLRRLGLLRPRGRGGRTAEQAFRAGAGRHGGGVVASAAYVPDSTTFESEIRLLSGRDPGGVYVASQEARTALQIAPQLSYYGMGSVAVAGGGAWADPGVIRRLRGGSPSLYATAVFTDRGPETAWAEFKALYERKYDRPLSDNVLPALGYDAMKAVLRAVDAVEGLPRRGALARAVATGDVEGATGRLRFRPGLRAARRTAEVRLSGGGELLAADPDRLAAWMREVRERQRVQERRRRERAAERVRRWSGQEGSRP